MPAVRAIVHCWRVVQGLIMCGALEWDCILDILKRKIRKLNTFPDQMYLYMKP